MNIDRILDHVTMYRLVLWYLAGLLAIALGLSALHVLPYDPLRIVFSTTVILAVCWVANIAFSRAFEVPANRESVYITALLLTLIMEPATAADPAAVAGLVLASTVAIASKFTAITFRGIEGDA